MIERPADSATPPAQPAAPRALTSAAVAAAGAVAAAVLGPVLARSGLLPGGAGEGIFRGAIPFAAVAVVFAIPALRRPGRRFRAVAIIVLAVAAAILPIRAWVAASSAPPIHDLTTDLDNPPRYVAVARLRVPPANAVEYGGEAVARQQRAAYDLRPLIVHAPPPRVLLLAADTARAEGWTVLAQDIGFGDLGRLEATDRSFLFGHLDDIVVRIVPHPAGSRVDVRSSARDSRDDGRNARRIRRFLAFLAERAAAEPAGVPASR